MRTAIVASLALLSVIGGGCPTVRKAPTPPVAPQAQAPTEAAAIRAERAVAGDSTSAASGCAFTYAYPVIEGEGQVIASLNKEIRIAFGLESTSPTRAVRTPAEIGDAYVNGCREELAQMRAELGDESVENMSYISETNYEVTLNRRGLLSLRINTYEYAGGAHGNPSMATLNLDLRTGKQLLLGDVVKSESLRALASWVRQEYLNAYEDALYDEVKEEFSRFIRHEDQTTDATLANDGSFLLMDDALVFHANVYELAPYAAGQLTVEAPYQKIHDYLDREGPIGRLVKE